MSSTTPISGNHAGG